MSNVTPLQPKRPSIREITEQVIRAKQILRAVRIAQDHDSELECQYAVEQVEDMLDQAGLALGELE